MNTSLSTAEASSAVPESIRERFRSSARFFETPLQQFQFFDKYSRYDWVQGHRETWEDTVERVLFHLRYPLAQDKLPEEDWTFLRTQILELKALPSMRLIATAGPAAERNGLSLYNCSYLPVQDTRVFAEALYLSMSGVGVGFSVEPYYVECIPPIPFQLGRTFSYTVEDTTEGWFEAILIAFDSWLSGCDVRFDYSKVRPAGSLLLTKGGRASGPEPLRDALDFARKRVLARQGQQLRPIDCHDIMCEIGNAAVSGGHRRTALISLFGKEDAEMRASKAAGFAEENKQRWNANNSIVWDEAYTRQEYDLQMDELFAGMSGEPGIYSRYAATQLAPERRKTKGIRYGTNPCAEINLRPFELCNLSIVVARREDTLESLMEKVRAATIEGTIQSLSTKNFGPLRDEWRRNCEEERLLGVDITGQLDSPIAQRPEVQAILKQVAIETNEKYARLLGIPQSAAITCVKPSGNSAVLLNASSGIHTRWAPYYIRNVRVSATSPVYKVLQAAGVPLALENGQTEENAVSWVASFPVKSPEGAIVRRNRGAIEQLEYYKQVRENWTEHNVSVTVYYRPEEKESVREWVWENKDAVIGVSFLPYSDAAYDQLPYIEITEAEYEKLAAEFPKEIDWSLLYLFETEDFTTAAQELACVSGVCELDYSRYTPVEETLPLAA